MTHHGGNIDDQKYNEEGIPKPVLGAKSKQKEFSHFSAISLCHGYQKSRKDHEEDKEKKENLCDFFKEKKAFGISCPLLF